MSTEERQNVSHCYSFAPSISTWTLQDFQVSGKTVKEDNVKTQQHVSRRTYNVGTCKSEISVWIESRIESAATIRIGG